MHISHCMGNHQAKHRFRRSQNRWLKLHSICEPFQAEVKHADCSDCNAMLHHYLNRHETVRVVSSSGHSVHIVVPPLPKKRGKRA